MKTRFSFALFIVVVAVASVIATGQEKGQPDKNATPAATTTAAADTRIPRNSRVYIAPMNGFETYLAAAFRKKEVPLIIVTERDNADFEISGTHDKKNAGWAKTIFLGDARGSASASMQIINMHTKVVVYADSSDRSSANRGERSTAEKLAKYLKQKIEDDEKKNK
jgi:hypothetical protein